MKDTIKNILREGTLKNSLGVTVTRPNQTLIVLRGIPGSGKSTKAKELVGEGAIHSTDDLIESQGDYRKFFSDMISSGNFGPLSEMHRNNHLNAVNSMKSGVTPVIIDNTNIRPSEAKNYVESALKLGYSDDNIKFVEIGTGGLLAEQLAERNTHGVPLDKIKSMIQAYESSGSMTLNKVLESKGMDNSSKRVLYSAVVLLPESIEFLQNRFMGEIESWAIDNKITPITKNQAHHMTIKFGKSLSDLGLSNFAGKTVKLTVTHLGKSKDAIAVRVEGFKSDNPIPHITLAYAQGSAPKDSNEIENWEPLNELIELDGVVTDVTN